MFWCYIQQKEFSALFPHNVTLIGIVLYIYDALLLDVYVSADINREKLMQTSNLVSIHEISPCANCFWSASMTHSKEYLYSIVLVPVLHYVSFSLGQIIMVKKC